MLVLLAVALIGSNVALAIGTPTTTRWNRESGTVVSAASAAAAIDAAHEDSAIPAGRIWKRITVLENFGDKVTLVNVGRRGNGIGDYDVFHDRLTDPSTDQTVGTIDAQCIVGYADMCNGTIRLTNRGQISFDGATPVGVDPDRYPITGGTGEFVDVGGVLRIDFPGIDFARLTLTLTH
jgi:hypothetical protein